MKNTQNIEKKEAQIMLITILVLMILAIVIVGLIIVLNRDIEQVTTNQKYEQVLNAAEGDIYELVSAYGTYELTLDDLASDPNLNTSCSIPVPSQAGGIILECTKADSQFTTLEVDREITVEDVKRVLEFTVAKDRGHAVNLHDPAMSATGYKGIIEIVWEGDVALDFTLIYQSNITNEYGAIKDVFDAYGIFDSLIGDDPFATPHSFNFQVLDPGNTTNAVKINLSAVSGVTADKVLKTLVITPRSLNTPTTKLTMTPVDVSTYPYQQRIFSVAGFDSYDEGTPVAKVQTIVPIFPQIDSIFDYSFITEGDISIKGI